LLLSPCKCHIQEVDVIGEGNERFLQHRIGEIPIR
jgi:hypothetical protein